MYSPNDYGAVQMLWPVGEYHDIKVPEPTLPRIEGARGTDDGQKLEWVQAIRAGKPSMALSNFDYASNLTESMLLGNVAVRSGQADRLQPRNRRDRRQLVGLAVSQALFPQGLGDLSDAGDPSRSRDSTRSPMGNVGGVGRLRRTFASSRL